MKKLLQWLGIIKVKEPFDPIKLIPGERIWIELANGVYEGEFQGWNGPGEEFANVDIGSKRWIVKIGKILERAKS